MSGFNVLMYYSGTLFALVGFSDPVAVGLVVSGTNLVMTCVNMMLVDLVGRRRLLVSTVWGMAASMVATAVAFIYIPVDLNTLEVQTNDHDPGHRGSSLHHRLRPLLRRLYWEYSLDEHGLLPHGSACHGDNVHDVQLLGVEPHHLVDVSVDDEGDYPVRGFWVLCCSLLCGLGVDYLVLP